MGKQREGDMEAGFPPYNEQAMKSNSDSLYPSMMESPELRWAFIRKVYIIVGIQLLLTAFCASVFIFCPPARQFAQHGRFEFRLLLILGAFVCSLIILFALWKFYKKHPVNLILLGIYTLCMSVSVGFACALVKGAVVMEAALLTGVVVTSLTLYTFWAVKRGHDFSFLWPLLFASLMVMMSFAIIQIFFPFGPLGRMIYSGAGAFLMCAFIVYDTNNLIKVYTYDEYIWASVSIYADIINLFLYFLSLLRDLL